MLGARTRATRTLAIALGAALMLSLGGCEKDPNDPKVWIDELGERGRLNEALRHLERLRDPQAIKPLGETWKKTNRQSNVLRAIINIAGKPKSGEPAWNDAIPYLVEAVESFDPGSRRSIDDAVVAAGALGRAKDPSTLQTLINAATKPLPKGHEGNHVRIAATLALGQFKDPRATDVLIRILETDPERQLVRLNAAAARALAESGNPKALPALTKALFMGPLYRQVRTALSRVGKPAVPVLITLYQEKDPEVQKLAKEKNFAKKAPGNVVYKAASLLGDLRAKEAVPLLTAGLKAEPRIAFYDERSGAPGPSTHEGILSGLRRIADPASAAAVKAFWTDPKTYDGTRPIAIDVYSMVASDTSALPDLLKWVRNNDAEPQIRNAAIIAYGRLARTAAEVKPIEDLIASYEAKIKAAEAKVKAAKNDDEKAQAEDDQAFNTAFRDALVQTKQRISVALECGKDPACYVKAIQVKSPKPGAPDLPRAERALVELTKMGPAAQNVTDALLKAASSTERFVREGVLLALPRVAPLPCDKCAERLDEVISAQEDQTTLDYLTEETRIVQHYFLWAGK